jgi:hypothetical protein
MLMPDPDLSLRAALVIGVTPRHDLHSEDIDPLKNGVCWATIRTPEPERMLDAGQGSPQDSRGARSFPPYYASVAVRS